MRHVYAACTTEACSNGRSALGLRKRQHQSDARAIMPRSSEFWAGLTFGPRACRRFVEHAKAQPVLRSSTTAREAPNQEIEALNARQPSGWRAPAASLASVFGHLPRGVLRTTAPLRVQIGAATSAL